MRRFSKLIIVLYVALIFLCSVYEVEASKEEPYKLGINDVIAVTVIGHGDLSVLATVAIDGSIAYPHLGTVYVKDKTLTQIEEEITEKLSAGFVKFPVVSVSLMKAVSKRIFLHGEVNVNGMIPFEKDMTVIQAISIGGGIRENGLYGKVKLRRRLKESGYENIMEAEINNGILKDSKAEDTLLKPDDILIVERSETFFLQGELAKTGQFMLERGMTVSRAITVAGGITESGLHGRVKLRRKKEGSTGYVDMVDALLDDGALTDNEIEDVLLQLDDILIVERSDTFFVQGELAKTGQYILERDMTVSRAIAVAGGIREDGLHGRVKLRRKKEGSTGYVDMIDALLDDGELTDKDNEDVLLQLDDILIIERSESIFIEGEVAAPGKYLLEYGMTVGRAITVAGGITEGGMYGKVKVRHKREDTVGYEDVEIDLEGIIEGSRTGDMVLQSDDILIIERSKTYVVYGEVNRIGEYPLANDTTIFKAIILAGGVNKWGSESKIKVLRLNNDGKGLVQIKVNIKDILDGDVDADIDLQPGDVVVVSSGIF